MTFLIIFLGWFVVSFIVGSFVGTMITFGTGSTDDSNEIN